MKQCCVLGAKSKCVDAAHKDGLCKHHASLAASTTFLPSCKLSVCFVYGKQNHWIVGRIMARYLHQDRHHVLVHFDDGEIHQIHLDNTTRNISGRGGWTTTRQRRKQLVPTRSLM